MMKNMKQVNKMLEQVNKDMNTSELVKVMDKFEQAFEDLDVKEKVMSDAIGQATATSTPAEAVQDLLRQIANENNLDIAAQLDAVPAMTHTITTAEQQAVAAQNRRLAELRHGQ